MKYYGIFLLLLILLNIVHSLPTQGPNNLLLTPDNSDNKRSKKLIMFFNWIEALYKKIYNNLINSVIKAGGRIGHIILNFGKTEDERFMVALDNIKVKYYFMT